MSYLEIDTLQGIIVVDPDRIVGIGEAAKATSFPVSEGIRHTPIVVLLLSGDHVDLYLHSEGQAKKLLEEVKEVINRRKSRAPTKPIIIGKE